MNDATDHQNPDEADQGGGSPPSYDGTTDSLLRAVDAEMEAQSEIDDAPLSSKDKVRRREAVRTAADEALDVGGKPDHHHS